MYALLTIILSPPQKHFHPFLENSTSSMFQARGKPSISLSPIALSDYSLLYSADPTEKTFTLFGKIKGRAEAGLLALPSTPAYSALRVYNVRPGYVDPPEHHRPRSLAQTVAQSILAPPLRLFLPSQVSPTGILSKVLVDLATGNGDALQAAKGSGIEAGGRTVRSSAIRRLAGEL